jgi:hypothetical protein
MTNKTYYYAVGKILRELDCDGEIVESYAFLTGDGEFTCNGIEEAVVHEDEKQALELAHVVFGRVIKIHHEFVEQLDIEVQP